MSDNAIQTLRVLSKTYTEKPSTTTAHNIAGAVPAALKAFDAAARPALHPAAVAAPAPVMLVPEPDSLTELLKNADAAGGRAARLAGKVRALIEELTPIVAMSQQERELREKVDAAAAELEKARAALKSFTGKPLAPVSAKPAPDDRPPAKTVRAWAERNGVDCKPNGIVPDRVYEAYAAAGGQDR